MNREEEIRMIAYALWVKEGYRHGKAVEHWLRAEAIYDKNHGIIKAPDMRTYQLEEPDEELEKVA